MGGFLVFSAPRPRNLGDEREDAVQRTDEDFMARAIELARRAAFTSPNPKVGCIVVKDGAIIGEGWHEGAGHPHAERRALDGIDASGSTLYVTLEPCNHHGRTPPCAPAVIEAGVARVVAATSDPDERVAGNGFDALRSAGVDVDVGVLEADAAELNAAYLHHRETGSSYLSLKLALSLDGGLAAADGSARWITGAATRRIVHVRRHEVDAVMVGAGTVLADDPELTVRDVPATRQPLAVIVDGAGRVPPSARVFATDAELLLATTRRAPDEVRAKWEAAGADVLVLPDGPSGVDLRALLGVLGERCVVEVLCEGGARLATSLVEADLVMRLELHFGAVVLGRDAVRLGDLATKTMADARRWHLVSAVAHGDDIVATFSPHREAL